MASETVAEDPAPEATPAGPAPPKERRRGVLSRIWRGVFGGKREDYEKKLEHLSKEEAAVHARMKRRAVRSRKMARNIILVSGVIEVAAVAFAIATVKSLDLNWTMKIVRTLPVIFSPGLSFIIYTAVIRLTRMFDCKDQKTLERLRAERKAKIDELKEITNYYSTQQLIQRYDLDPAAKAAAASVLASKLGAESGLNVHLGDESNTNPPSTRSNDAELVQSTGLRNRKNSHVRSSSTGSSSSPHSVDETPRASGPDDHYIASQSQIVVEHHQGSSPHDGGWIARIAALLVGEDPSQCYALICGNCHRHNGLARREDFPHITYFCPHCHALNTSKPIEHGSGSISCVATPTSADGTMAQNLSNASSASGSEVVTNTATTTQEPTVGVVE